jgi:hypothetical protein
VRKGITRRRFLILGGGTTLGALIGGAYVMSGCPLSDSGVCVGPCAADIDLDHDGVCDRIQRNGTEADDAGVADTASAPRCPLGLREDPYPGQCKWYVDADGDGYCDLALGVDAKADTEAEAQASVGDETVPPLPEEAQDEAVACPFGLVNDPYPGQCKWYVDADGDGICDLSVPGSATAEDAPAPHVGRGGGRGQRRRGQRGSDES